MDWASSSKTFTAELAERGLRTRASGRWPSGPLSMSKLAVVLRDPYYTGVVTYQGEQYSGRHKPLITRELFERVQVVIDAHATAVERDRRHHHYLKGTLWCGVCHDRGQESRLLLQRTVGRRGGEYWYYFCRARQDGGCTSPHQRVEAIEDAIVRHYAHIRLPEGVAEALRHLLDVTLADEERTQRALAAEHAARLRQLDTAEENLLDLAAEGKLPNAKIRARLATIAEKRERLSEASKGTAEKLTAGAAVLRQAIDLIDDIQEFLLAVERRGPPHDQPGLLQKALRLRGRRHGRAVRRAVRRPDGTERATRPLPAQTGARTRKRRPEGRRLAIMVLDGPTSRRSYGRGF